MIKRSDLLPAPCDLNKVVLKSCVEAVPWFASMVKDSTPEQVCLLFKGKPMSLVDSLSETQIKKKILPATKLLLSLGTLKIVQGAKIDRETWMRKGSCGSASS